MVSNAFEVLTSEFLSGASLVLRIAEFPFIRSIAAIVIMITSPALVDATAILASELIIGARLRCWAIVEGDILIGPINAIRVAVAEPLLRNALRPSPGFVFLASELSLRVALSVIFKKINRLAKGMNKAC